MSLSAKDFSLFLLAGSVALAGLPGVSARSPRPACPPPDPIFADGFDGPQPSISDNDDLTEGALGISMIYSGDSYHDVNGIGGVFPDGNTFTPADVGDELII